ncbi:MAG TPA: hypothetical protein VEC12_04685 [Bacteroidia bacterium]|nr:hypothetical protein [Bacteroidia bacterium]
MTKLSYILLYGLLFTLSGCNKKDRLINYYEENKNLLHETKEQLVKIKSYFPFTEIKLKRYGEKGKVYFHYQTSETSFSCAVFLDNGDYATDQDFNGFDGYGYMNLVKRGEFKPLIQNFIKTNAKSLSIEDEQGVFFALTNRGIKSNNYDVQGRSFIRR